MASRSAPNAPDWARAAPNERQVGLERAVKVQRSAGGGTGPTAKGEGESVLPFGPGMTRPSLLSKTDPTYTREALAASVQGLMLVKCTITLQGALTACRVVKVFPTWMPPFWQRSPSGSTRR